MDLHKGKDYVKTDCHCTNCNKNFIAKLDFNLDGQHVVECPWCGHEHCRVIKNGEVTGDRWDSRNHLPKVEVDKRCVWKHDSQPIMTTSASAFIRDRWLNRES